MGAGNAHITADDKVAAAPASGGIIALSTFYRKSAMSFSMYVKTAMPGTAGWGAAGVGAARLGAAALLLSCAACGGLSLPFLHGKAPDLTPARASAENLIRLDAATRSGCERVDNIQHPRDTADPRDPAAQRWVARTCNGDISYDVVTVPGPKGPTLRVTPVPGPIIRPINPNFRPAMPDGSPAAQ